VIIGGGTACFSATRTIRASDPKSKVFIISESDHLPYMKPPLSKELWFTPAEVAKKLKFRQSDVRDRPLAFEKPEFYFTPQQLMQRDSGGVCLIRGQRVAKIDCEGQTIFLENGQSLKYDKCLIATGGESMTHPVLESSSSDVKEKVMDYRTVDDFLTIQSKLSNLKSVLIYGGGLLGTELGVSMAAQTKDFGLKVLLVCQEKGLLWKILPSYLSHWLTKRLATDGLEVIPEADIASASTKNNRLSVHLTNGSDVEVDQVIVTTRSQVVAGANKRLAEASGLEIDPVLGGFVTNAEMQARTNVWVAGDAASFYDMKLGRRRRVEQHDQAIISARLAGENMTGSHKPLKQQAMFWSDLTPDLGFEAAGLIDSSLETVGVFATGSPDQTPGDDSVPPEDYNRGVVFYLIDKKIVGILMMNVFNRVRLARRILRDDRVHDDLSDVAKWFNIYSQEEE
jgi:programmed cell death 8 (apoptosis-inducing factor)